MMSYYLSDQVDTFAPWLKNFAVVTAAHRGRFGLDEAALAQIEISLAVVEEVSDRRSAAEIAAKEASSAAARAQRDVAAAEGRHAEAQQALATATTAREQALADAMNRVRPVVDRLQVRDESSRERERQARASSSTVVSADTVLASIGAPTDLVAVSQKGQVNILQWSIGSSELSSQFLLEASVGKLYRGSPIPPDASGYRHVATVTGPTTTYRHSLERITPGVQVRYRARAKRGELLSAYSNEVVVTCK
jgi:hypothetical protein